MRMRLASICHVISERLSLKKWAMYRAVPFFGATVSAVPLLHYHVLLFYSQHFVRYLAT